MRVPSVGADSEGAAFARSWNRRAEPSLAPFQARSFLVVQAPDDASLRVLARARVRVPSQSCCLLARVSLSRHPYGKMLRPLTHAHGRGGRMTLPLSASLARSLKVAERSTVRWAGLGRSHGAQFAGRAVGGRWALPRSIRRPAPWTEPPEMTLFADVVKIEVGTPFFLSYTYCYLSIAR